MWFRVAVEIFYFIFVLLFSLLLLSCVRALWVSTTFSEAVKVYHFELRSFLRQTSEDINSRERWV